MQCRSRNLAQAIFQRALSSSNSILFQQISSFLGIIVGIICIGWGGKSFQNFRAKAVLKQVLNVHYETDSLLLQHNMGRPGRWPRVQGHDCFWHFWGKCMLPNCLPVYRRCICNWHMVWCHVGKQHGLLVHAAPVQKETTYLHLKSVIFLVLRLKFWRKRFHEHNFSTPKCCHLHLFLIMTVSLHSIVLNSVLSSGR